MKRRTSIANKLAIVTSDECRRMAYADFAASGMTGDAEHYFLTNQAGYSILSNTWFLQMEEIQENSWIPITYEAQTHGLFSVIASASALADRIVAVLSDETREFRDLHNSELGGVDTTIWASLLGASYASSPILTDANCVGFDDGEFVCEQLLQVLRYPKRFSPEGLDSLKDVCTTNFVQLLRDERKKLRCERNWYIVSQLREIMSDILPHIDEIAYAFCCGAEFVEVEREEDGKIFTFFAKDYVGGFSPGATAEIAGREMRDSHKLQVLAQSTGTYRGMPLLSSPFHAPFAWETKMPWDPSNPFLNAYDHPSNPYRDQPHDPYVAPDCARFQPVNKNYKTARGIAEESTYKQGAGKGFSNLLYDVFSKLSKYRDCYTRDDQGKQQERCRLGSVQLTWASIDLSSASDTNDWVLVQDIFPSFCCKVLSKLRSGSVLITRGAQDVLYTCEMAFTSGNCCTFPVESFTFLSIMILATFWASLPDTVYKGRGRSKRLVLANPLPHPSVYGDDCIVPYAAFDTACELLAVLGFRVNEEKSFSGPYLEACGAEYYCGVDLSTRYWPRKTLLGTSSNLPASSLLAIIDLQHRLYEFQNCRIYLSWLVKDFMPWMTSSLPYTECVDLWEENPSVIHFTASFEYVDGKWVKRTVDKSYEGHYIATTDGRKERPAAYPLRRLILHRPHVDVSRECMDESAMYALLEEKAYIDFLIDGPVYDTALDRLLKVSTRRDPFGDLASKNTIFKPVFKA